MSKSDDIKTINYFKWIVDNSPDMIALLSKDFVYLAVNKAYADTLKKKPSDIIGKTPSELLGKQYYKRVIEPKVKECLKGKTITFQEYIEFPLGPKHLEFNYFPYRQGKDIKGVVLNGKDISGRKQAEESLEESEKKYKDLFNNMRNAVAIYEIKNNGKDCIFKDFNITAEKIEKIKKQDLIGKNVLDVFPGAKKGFLDVFKRVWKTGKAEFNTNFIYSEKGKINSVREFYTYKLPSGDVVAIYEDITERVKAAEDIKKSEEKSKEREARFSKTIEKTGQLAYSFAPTTDKVIWHGAIKEVTGYEPEEFCKFDVAEWAMHIHHADREKVLATMENALESRSSFAAEYRLRRKDGSYIYVEEHGAWLSDGIESEYTTVGVIKDITIRKKVEEEFQEILAFNQTLLNSSPDIIYVYDIEKRTNVYSNERIVSSTGFTPNEIKDMGDQLIQILMHPDDFKIYLEDTFARYMQLKDGEFIEHTFRMKNKKGDWLWFNCRETIFQRNESGRPKQIFGIMIDFTEKKKVEEALKKSEEKFRKVIEGSHDAIVILDFDGNIIDSNEAGIKLSGYSKKEALSMNFSQMHDKKEAINARIAFKNVLKRGKSSYEITLLKKDKTKVPVSISSSIIEIDEKKYILSIAKDISGLKQAEEQIQKSLKEKEILLRELYHRTKNNMQVICSMLHLKGQKTNTETYISDIADVENKIQSMAMVYQNLMQSDDLSHIDLKQYFENLISYVKHSMMQPEQNISILTSLKAIDVVLDVAIPLGLVLNELISNAIKHAFKSISSGKVTIKLDKTAQNEIKLIVSDNGPGLPKKLNIKQLNSIGLNTVIGLVEHQLNGTISFQSEIGFKCEILVNNKRRKDHRFLL